jgi:hypothetical protein
MWSWEKKTVDVAAKVTINTLEMELARSNNEVSELKRQISEFTNAARSATFWFDFTAVKAFSVERNLDNKNLPVTVIGYLLSEPVVVTEDSTTTKDVVREWYLPCDDKQHEAIVKAFKESIK